MNARPTENTRSETTTDTDWTGRKLIQATVLAVLLGLSLGAFILAYKGHFRPAALNPFVASLKLVRAAHVGKSIVVAFTVRNRSPERLPIGYRAPMAIGRRDEFDVEVWAVTASKPETLTKLPDFQMSRETFSDQTDILSGSEPKLVELGPGETQTWNIDIQKFVSVAKPGLYRLVITRHPYPRFDPIHVSIRSEALDFEVLD